MNLVKTVRTAYRAAISTMTGKTRSIHGVSQTPPREKMFCISIDRCTASVIGSMRVLTAIRRSLRAGGRKRVEKSEVQPLLATKPAATVTCKAQGTLEPEQGATVERRRMNRAERSVVGNTNWN